MSEIPLSFGVQSWLRKHRHLANQVHFSQPLQIAYWTKLSDSEGGDVRYGDRSGLHQFSQPEMPASLSEGYPHQYLRKSETESVGVERIVQAANQAEFQWDQCNVCTFRNNLNKVGLTPLNLKDAWVVDGVRLASTLFLDIQATDRNSFEGQDLFTYYGYKFETLCTGGGEKVDSTSEFAAVLRLRLAGHSVLMAAELDCYDPAVGSSNSSESPPPQNSYIELKTCRIAQHPGHVKGDLRNKYPKWWLQSWLAGVETLIVGRRDEGGMLRSIERLPVRSLPRAAAEGGQQWNPWTMLAFLDAFLAWARALASSRKGEHLRFHYDPKQQTIRCEVLVGGDLPERLSGLLRPTPTIV